MAGYFSNHSQSRFLANSSNGVQNSSSTATSTMTTAPNQSAPRRVPSSKHFSTSVSTSSSGDEKPMSKEKLGGPAVANGAIAANVHPLRNTWVFWFRQQRSPGNKITNYEEGIKKISTFSSVESFWSLWTHLNVPSTLQPTTDYLLFHSNIRRPVWEDPVNIQGGKWIIRLKKEGGIADRLWEEIVLAIVGDQFDDCGPTETGGVSDAGSWRNGGAAENGGTGNGVAGSEPEICGCTLSVRQSEDILSVWNKHGYDSKVNQKIKDTIKRVLELPPNTVIEYKTNNDSMQDKPVFRNVSQSERNALS